MLSLFIEIGESEYLIFMCNYWNVEITTNSAASAFWFPGSTHSHELTPAEVQSRETCGVWPSSQKEINTNGSCNRTEGIWPSSPHVNVSLDLFSDSAEDNKTVTAQSTIPDYLSPGSSMLNNGPINDHVEKRTKAKTFLGCRLFGIDLTKNSQTTAPPDRESAIMMSSSAKGSSSTAIPEADRLHNLDASKSSNEQKQLIPDMSLKETQSKQGSTLSMRTRTKV